MFSSKSLIVSGLTFKSLIPFEFVFLYDVKKHSNFILLHKAVWFSQTGNVSICPGTPDPLGFCLWLSGKESAWETQVQSLGEEDSMEKGMANHSIFFPGEFHGQMSLVGYSHKELDVTE